MVIEYSVEDVVCLDSVSAVRTRPQLYVTNYQEPEAMTALVAGACYHGLQEILAGRSDQLEIHLRNDGAWIFDYGQPVPVERMEWYLGAIHVGGLDYYGRAWYERDPLVEATYLNIPLVNALSSFSEFSMFHPGWVGDFVEDWNSDPQSEEPLYREEDFAGVLWSIHCEDGKPVTLFPSEPYPNLLPQEFFKDETPGHALREINGPPYQYANSFFFCPDPTIFPYVAFSFKDVCAWVDSLPYIFLKSGVPLEKEAKIVVWDQRGHPQMYARSIR